MRILEELNARGLISHADEVLLRDIEYSITFFENEIDDRRGGSVPGGVRRMRGQIHVDALQGARLILYSDPLTLTLADGRTMSFRLVNSETGEIVRASGGDL